jgi:hypothetical protein
MKAPLYDSHPGSLFCRRFNQFIMHLKIVKDHIYEKEDNILPICLVTVLYFVIAVRQFYQSATENIYNVLIY